jgi:23S rRNA-/tRNA-specific pseudouridylate synthase
MSVRATPTVAHHDGHVAVVCKPAGMSVHPAGAAGGDDLVTWAASALGPGFAPIHRLDRETSGLVLLSDDAGTRGALGALFAEGKVHKRYLALVVGKTHAKGTIRAPLLDRRRGRPLDAVTRYHRVEALGGFTLLAVEPETGRQHQIRRHLQGIGHAIVGDTRYRPGRPVRVPAFPGRLWLHAERLDVPGLGVFEVPLPPELVAHLEAVRLGAENRLRGASVP